MNTPQEKKDISIVINGRPKIVEKEEISFEELVALAFDPPPYGTNTLFTVTFKRGHGSKPEGTLTMGGAVRVKDGMIFNVTATDKS